MREFCKSSLDTNFLLNSQVKESYSRISAARVKKRALTKKEKDAAWKSIKDREIILKQLESI
jgi:transcriptional adapter 3